ncbi:hypothetical protein TNCV_3802741 [Trichonephila clavipes]|nr:hypothetical protein TNCV_3802741 [Trichonephila clavipes]
MLVTMTTGLPQPFVVWGSGSLVVMVTGSWLACREFETSTAEDLPCRLGRCKLNKSRLNVLPLLAEDDERSCRSVASRTGDAHRFCSILIASLGFNGYLEAKRYTRAFGDGPRNFEPWSSDVDDT